MKADSVQIPGKSIRPPDKPSKYRCPHCGNYFVYPKQGYDNRTNKVIFMCPYCGKRL